MKGNHRKSSSETGIARGSRDTQLQRFLEASLARLDDGDEVDVARICEGHSALIPQVEAALRTARQLRRAADPSATRCILGRYELGECLGRGAMGVVHAARDLSLRRPVAIKTLRAIFTEPEEAESRFAREAEALAAVRHTSVAVVYDRGRTKGGDEFLVMELLDGASLADLLDQLPANGHSHARSDSTGLKSILGEASTAETTFVRAVVRWVADLASGLGAAHKASILHRDVKPSNVFICRDGRAVLIDFGLALPANHASLTSEGTIVGTPAYLPPEMLNGSASCTPASDVYSLSAVLYRAVTGHEPYAGTPSQILAAVRSDDPPPPQQRSPLLSKSLGAIIEKGMARRLHDRYASAAALEEDLRAFLDHQPVQARPLRPVQRWWRRVQRSTSVRAAAGMVLVGLLGAGTLAGVAARSAYREHRTWSALRQLPPNFDIVSLANRLTRDDLERRGVGELLDEAACFADDVLPTFAVRASFRLDGGDAAGASRDMRRVAASLGTPYARALARAYAGLDAEARGALALDLSNLPSPQTPEDLYLAGYHALRQLRTMDAKRIFTSPGAGELRCGAQLGALFLASRPASMHARAVELELEQASRSAMSAHLVGTSQRLQSRYASALEIYMEALTLAPQSFVLLENAAACAYGSGLFDLATEHYEAALALRPEYFKLHDLRIAARLAAMDSDGAEACVAQAPYPSSPQGIRQRSVHLGDADAVRALAHWHRGQHGLAREPAENAVAHYDDAAQLGADVTSGRARIARVIAGQRDSRLIPTLVASAASEPLNTRRIETLAAWIEASSDDSALVDIGLTDYLHALHYALRARAAIDEQRLLATFPSRRASGN